MPAYYLVSQLAICLTGTDEGKFFYAMHLIREQNDRPDIEYR